MRNAFASFLIIAAVVVWGIWCGGQYFNEARVIPKMLSTQPDAVVAYNAIPTDGAYHFSFRLILIFSLIAGGRQLRRGDGRGNLVNGSRFRW